MPFECSPLFGVARRVRKPEARQLFIEMAETWNRLASVTECDQTLFQAISEIGLTSPMMLCLALSGFAWGNTPRRPSQRATLP